MESYLYDLKYALEDTECRAVARRELIGQLWSQCQRTIQSLDQAKILEVGCGTGATLKSLHSFGKVVGIDVSMAALRYSRDRGIRNVLQASGTALPFVDGAFDLVVSMDVLEHVEGDVHMLEQLYRVLKPQGILILIVPSFQSLWSSRDVRLGHKRRYSLQELKQKVGRVGFCLKKMAYLDALAFPAFYLWVKAKSLFGEKTPDIQMDMLAPPRLLNAFLLRLMRLENQMLTRLPAPFGVALLCVAQRS